MRKNWKKAMAGTLSICMLATGVSGVGELGELVHKSNVVYAATTENVVSGECGDKAIWQYDKETKTLTISGSGDMKSYYVGEDVDAKPWEEDDNKIIDNRPWAEYKNEIREVVVEDEITKIGQDAFLGCISLEKVKLGKNVKKIMSRAFEGATALTKIDIGDKVEVISYNAFYDCKSLKSITIGKSVRKIEMSVFAGCIGLEKIKVNSKNKYFMVSKNNLINKKGTMWYGGCFANNSTCNITDKITIIDYTVMERISNIKSIKVSSKNKTFSSKDGLLYSKNGKELYFCPTGKKGTITVQEKTTTIGKDNPDVFKNCANIEKIVIGKNVKKLCFNAEGCTKLKEIKISKKNAKYSSAKGSILSKAGKVLEYCVSTDNGTYKIPDGVECVKDYVFHRKYTGEYSYEGDNAIISVEHIIFPDSMKGWSGEDEYDFYGVDIDGLKSITLGKEFYNGKTLLWLTEDIDQTNLEAVYISEKNPYYSSVDGIVYDKEQTKLLFCPSKAKICKMPDTVTSVNENAFYDDQVYYENQKENGLEELYVSDAIEDISGTEWIFGWKLKKLHLGKSVNEVNVNMYAKSLEQLTVSTENNTYKAVDNILYTKDGSQLLYCPKTRSAAVTVCSGTSVIGESSFHFCKKVTEITLPDSVTTVEENAFKHIDKNAVFKVPVGKKEFFEKLLTSETGFETTMTIKEE